MHMHVGSPAGAGKTFLALEHYEKLELFEMHTCLEPGAQIFRLD